MIVSKVYSIATILYLVSSLFSAVLVDSAKIECIKGASSKDLNENKERFMIFLEPKKGSTSAASSDSEILKQHLNFYKDCWDIDSAPALEESDGIATKSFSSNKLLHFSVGSLVGYFGSFNPQVLKEQIKTLPNIKIVEKVTKVKAFAAIQKRASTVEKTSFYDLDRIDQRKRPLNGKYQYPSSAGSGVNVYVIDTGINKTKSEFGNRVRFAGVFCDGCPRFDDEGHGTEVASVIGGIHFGVAKKVKLIAIKVLDSEGSGTFEGVISGMMFVLKEHLANKNKNTVINISLGGGFSSAVNKAVNDLTKAGIHVVVAAGNESQNACFTSPASAPTAITVGATDKGDDSMADFSNFGPCVDIFAPGVEVPVLSFGRPSLDSGTSFSSPLTAGVVALKISASGNLSPKKMAEAIISDINSAKIKCPQIAASSIRDRLDPSKKTLPGSPSDKPIGHPANITT
ncbi:17336_t:CDS:2 [Entrophospora sp. SA101]|nr:17336_t:CDS:2 [Entrophospora sp. SA101]